MAVMVLTAALDALYGRQGQHERSWAGDVAPQHRDLVPQHEDLGVLGRLPAAQQYEPADELKQIREKA
jgi:hypothetical protein